MIYTGITRAKHLVAICSKAEVLRYAVSRKVERESALLDGCRDEERMKSHGSYTIIRHWSFACE
jgi:ATP-dependent exoDNAse (exonuclease V) alpha subunit